MATFLQAVRTRTLPALQTSPEDQKIHGHWVNWLTDLFTNHPTLRITLQNPHPNSIRLEQELWSQGLNSSESNTIQQQDKKCLVM